MVLTVIKNWDKKNWLSSKDYILSFNKFLLKISKLNSNSKILDIGCGRGKIIGTLSSYLKLKNKPIGLDIVNHQDKDKRIDFNKIDALNYLKSNDKKFDLILIKQTIHLFKLGKIRYIISLSKKKLNPGGKILIFTLNPYKNEFPIFSLMKNNLTKSLKRDQDIINFITKKYPKRILKYFSYKVNISKRKYTQMISERFISTLLPLSKKEILSGVNEINVKYKKNLLFNDKLVCIILQNN